MAMKDGPTYRLGKHRKYDCPCGAKPRRPLRAEDTQARPFPVPCEMCGNNLHGVNFEIEDANIMAAELLRECGDKPYDPA